VDLRALAGVPGLRCALPFSLGSQIKDPSLYYIMDTDWQVVSFNVRKWWKVVLMMKTTGGEKAEG
jgi:hypothetical protein